MTKLKCGILAGLIVAGVATTAVVLTVMPRKAAVQTRLPNPNGYAYFVKAAQMVRRNSTYPDDLDHAGLRALVSQNAEALTVARRGFQYPSRAADNGATNWAGVLTSFKLLGQAFYAEGKLAEMENRREDAIRSYLDYVRLGQETSRGGILIVRFVGIAVEQSGLNRLRSMAGSVDLNQSKETVLALQGLDAREPPLNDIFEQQHAYDRIALVTRPSMSLLLRRLEEVFQFGTKASFEQKATAIMQANQLALRQTMIAFAVRAYELDKKHSPKTLGDLTPDYLKTIPQDPRSSNNMVFAP